MKSKLLRLPSFLSLGLLTLSICLASFQRLSADSKPRMYRDKVDPNWILNEDEATAGLWYRIETGADAHQFIHVDATTGIRQPAFDHARAAMALSQSLETDIAPENLPIQSLKYQTDADTLILHGEEQQWSLDLKSYELSPLKEKATKEPNEEKGKDEPRQKENCSPDGRWEVFVRGHNLVMKDTEGGEERQLTFDGHSGYSYARNAEAARSVSMRYKAKDPETPEPEIYWAPDSRHFVAMRHTLGSQRRVALLRSAPEDQLQPKLEYIPYLKPGDDVPYAKPHLFSVAKQSEISVDDSLFKNPWEIENVHWSPESNEFRFLYNERGHQALRILGVRAKDGAVRTIVDESSDTFICYSNKFFAEFADDSGELIWMSERDGWNHLYLYDIATGEVKNPITTGEWVVRGVDHVDTEKRQIWFRASGRNPGEDPYHVHHYRISFDGSGLTELTQGDGDHSVNFSPDRKFLVDTWSRVDSPPVSVMRRSSDGSFISELEEADIHELEAAGRQPPERFVAKGRDGETDIYGLIYRPDDFNPAESYPIIEAIYAGPHSSFVPKRFSARKRYDYLTSLGFVVVKIDGMGTSNRSKAFHDVCWKNLKDAGLPDRILWMKAAAETRPWMDLSRVGIYGGSAGGQSALGALLFHGDFYKAAVADCGCHDNRMDKIWWNEQWMGWPVDESYARSSNVENAHKLEGKLLLMVGEMDKNVDPASTRQVAAALIKADKEFEYVEFPNSGHGTLHLPYGRKRLVDFFIRAFLSPEDQCGEASDI